MNKELLNYFNGDEVAAEVWLNKYAAKGEVTPRDMHMRMAAEFARIERNYPRKRSPGLSKYGRVRTDLNQKRIFELFDKFKYIIPQGSVMSQLGTKSIGSLSNCFVVRSPYDSYGGIFNTDQELGQLFKRRCGVGVDISTLRPNGMATSNVAKTSTGAVSFMERYSSTTREVAQGGRRGALMLSMDIRHPDIMDFIKIKQDLTKVTGANISVRVNDSFMSAVEENGDYYLTFPVDEDVDITDLDLEYNKLKIIKDGNKRSSIMRVKAKEVWDELISSAHSSAEPGIMFWDNILNAPDSVYKQYIPTSTNPCGEIPIEANNSCRLIAVNLTSFVINPYQSTASFDLQKFKRVVYEALRLNDDLVDLELEAVDRIIDKIMNDSEPADIKSIELNLWRQAKKVGRESRRTGLGFTGLGDTLAMLGMKYGGDESIGMIEHIMQAKMSAELDCTTDMAIERGHFDGWKSTNEYIKSYDGQNSYKYVGANGFYQNLITNFPEQAHRMMLYGRRNVSWSTVAPTGSLSMLAQVSSGIEPVFQTTYTRRRKIHFDSNDTPDFVDDLGDKWKEDAIFHEEFRNWMIYSYGVDPITSKPKLSKKQIKDYFEASPWYGSTANDIDYNDRVLVQAVIQKYTTHSISSTINLPKNVSKEVVSNIYMYANKMGLKGVTVYRDGSRDGVLITKKKKAKFSYAESIKRPEVVNAYAHSIIIGGEKYSVYVGLVDDIPYEIFAYKGGTAEAKGFIFREGKGLYYFMGENKESRNRILSGKMTDEQEAFTRLLSGSLRHGRDIKFIVKDLDKTSGNMFSFNAAISKVLKKYIPNGTSSIAKCQNPDCSGDGSNVIYEEGCHKCLDCGSSACG